MSAMIGYEKSYVIDFANKSGVEIFEELRGLDNGIGDDGKIYNRDIILKIDARLVGNTEEGGHAVAIINNTFNYRIDENGITLYTMRLANWGHQDGGQPGDSIDVTGEELKLYIKAAVVSENEVK